MVLDTTKLPFLLDIEQHDTLAALEYLRQHDKYEVFKDLICATCDKPYYLCSNIEYCRKEHFKGECPDMIWIDNIRAAEELHKCLKEDN